MKKFITRATLLSFSLAPVLAFAQHTPIQGVVKVLDGDTLAMKQPGRLCPRCAERVVSWNAVR